jgi:type IV secretory pathway VirB2 component (pilin)
MFGLEWQWAAAAVGAIVIIYGANEIRKAVKNRNSQSNNSGS